MRTRREERPREFAALTPALVVSADNPWLDGPVGSPTVVGDEWCVARLCVSQPICVMAALTPQNYAQGGDSHDTPAPTSARNGYGCDVDPRLRG
jgi:hypothetical protein